MLKDILKLLIVLATILLNIFLVWVLLHDPFSQLLIDKNQPYHDVPPTNFIEALTFTIMFLLIAGSILFVFIFFKKRKLFMYVPIFSLLVLLTLFIIGATSLQYPSSIYYETKDDHFYINEVWWNQPNHKRIFKRWRSIHPYHQKLDPAGKILFDTSIKYTIDSFSETSDKH